VLLALAITIAPASSATVPALTAFDEVLAHVNDYTVTVHSHEVKGDQSQDRVYQFWYKKPHFIKTQIISGPGAGGGAVWTGGDTVSGHLGGLFSFVRLKVGIHDRRAVSLRGYTIPDGRLEVLVNKYKDLKGQLSEHNGPKVGGQESTMVELRLADETDDPGVARAVIYFSKTTHLPLAQIRYDSSGKILSQQIWTDLRLNVGLKDSDF
jgi:hypothetical protein